MESKIGFIGCGNMASAMIAGIINSNVALPCNIIGSNPSKGKLISLKEKYKINITSSNIECIAFSNILFLSVKPNKYASVIEEIKSHLKDDTIIVTIAAGISISFVQKCFGKKVKVARLMPNTSALVGESMTAVCASDNMSKEDLKNILDIVNSFGKYEMIDESLMDVIPAISGSSPAYIYMLIEAMGDGGVLSGLPRDKSYRMAAQAVYGAAKMVLECEEHPAKLKDNVCSPGGTTIEAVYTLEKSNFRASIISAMEACTNKTIAMSMKNLRDDNNEVSNS